MNANPNADTSAANSTDPMERWAQLFDRGMYQLARIEIRGRAEGRNADAAALYALGLAELAMHRDKEARRAFTMALEAARRQGTAALPPRFGSLLEVLRAILEWPDLRRIPMPSDPFHWLDRPGTVGREVQEEFKPGRITHKLREVVFESPMKGKSFAELEQRASTPSYDVFRLGSMTPATGASQATAGRLPNEPRRRESREVRRPQPQPAPPPKAAPPQATPLPVQSVPPPAANQWNPAPKPFNPAPAPIPAAPTTPPPPAPPPAMSFAPPPQPPPMAPLPPGGGTDFWAQWEAELQNTIASGKVDAALLRVQEMTAKFPESSRLAEHEARLLQQLGRADQALAAWLRTHARAVQSKSLQRAELASQQAVDLVRDDPTKLLQVADSLRKQGPIAMGLTALKIAVYHLARDGKTTELERAMTTLLAIVEQAPEAATELEGMATMIQTQNSSGPLRRLADTLVERAVKLRGQSRGN